MAPGSEGLTAFRVANNITFMEYESIKNKLRKLMALAEKGVGGEAVNAKVLFDKLCREYHIDPNEIINGEEKTSRYKFKIGRDRLWLDLFMQCYAKITGYKSMSYFVGRKPSEIELELTAYQAAELKNLFDWHKSNFMKDLDILQETALNAYFYKHDLFREATEDDEPTELTQSDLERLRKVWRMETLLNENKYQKLIQ